MTNYRQCANAAIDAYIKAHVPDVWPDWADSKPSDWMPNQGDWIVESRKIVRPFERCCGLQIDISAYIAATHTETLSDLSELLVDEANRQAAHLAVQSAERDRAMIIDAIDARRRARR